jgi:hypothetical protein
VSGRLVVKINAPEYLRSIIVEFRGRASFEYSIDSVMYARYEKYFEKYVKVFGGRGYTEVLQSGEHYFQFSMILPKNLPSSFEGPCGYVRYTVKATLDRPWKFDRKVNAFFTVLSHLDLTVDPKNKESVKKENCKSFCCFFCKSGPLTLATHIPARGYVPGQSIPMTIEVDNASDVKVKKVTCELEMIVSYHATSVTTRTFRRCALLILEGVEKYNSRTWASKIAVPQLPPSSLPHCNIMDVDYILKVNAETNLLHDPVQNSLPINIGTVPVWQDTFSEQGRTFPSPQQIIAAPSAPPPDTGEVLHPERTSHSYEECKFGTSNIKDSDDNEHTLRATGYFPRYPTLTLPTALPGSTTFG